MITIFDVTVLALLDSGAEATCASDGLWLELQQHHASIPQLPLRGVTLTGAVGAKSTKVTKQAMLPLTLGGWHEDVPTLIVPGLMRKLILGADFLDNHGGVLDFSVHQLFLHGAREGGVAFASCVQVRMSSTARVGAVATWEGDNHLHLTEEQVEALRAEGTLRRCDPRVNLAVREQSHRTVVASLSTTPTTEDKIRAAVQAAETASDEQKSELYTVLLKYSEIFRARPGCIRGYTPVLQLTDPSGFVEKQYPLPLAYEGALDRLIQQWQDWGIITRAPSNYISPLVTAPKKDGSIRACIDGRRISRVLVPDPERPQPAEELMARHYGARWLTTMDASMGYLHIALRPQDRQYLAFLYKGRSYVFCRLVYGTAVSGAHFIRAMDMVLGTECLSFTSIYVDDELFTAPTWELHIQRLDLLLQRHLQHDVSINLEKSKFCRTAVPFLGVILTPSGQSPDPDYTRAIREFPEPRSVTHLLKFLGVCNFYRKFTPFFAEHTAQLVPLLRKGVRWGWTPEHRAAFDRLKAAFLDTVMLAYPIPGEDFLIRSDSSDYAIAAVLSQVDPRDGEEAVIAFMSRTLKGPETRYNICEKECLAVVFALQKWSGLVMGSKITVETDNKSVSFLMKCRLHTARLSRWVMFMSNFRLTVRHIPGATNLISDVLSRFPPSEPGQPDAEHRGDIILARIATEERPMCDVIRRLGPAQRDDPTLVSIIELLEAAAPPTTNGRAARLAQHHLLFGGVLFRRAGRNPVWRAVVPVSLQSDIIVAAHLSIGHFGARKVVTVLQERFTWRHMEKHIRKKLATCDLCQRAKHRTVRHEGEHHHILASAPGELALTDLYGPLPPGPGAVQYVLVIVDACTKHVALYALRQARAPAMVRRVLEDYIPKHGPVRKMLSDHGTQYTSKAWVQGLEKAGTLVVYSTIRHPQSNPAERVMRTLGQMFRIYCHDQHTRWPRLLGQIESWINNTVHDSIGTTPAFLHHGRHPTWKWRELLPLPPCPGAAPPTREEALQRAAARARAGAAQRKQRHDARGPATTYKEGDLVLLRTEHHSDKADRVIQKFFLLFEGPFVVARRAAPNAYLLADRDGREVGTHNIVNLRPYRTEDAGQPGAAVVSPLGTTALGGRRT
ncbi:Transposon Tf2-9 polyprotein [Frankliniella fusca]|uniref:RNA-directed DNA polymerase n=1 Tax=Frankliniella fusca TaxID=407009 RepID=A0AAE1H829_9NEOP|nr:Transposon Tf2-9 polyprotein [Frankliniella fusca]